MMDSGGRAKEMKKCRKEKLVPLERETNELEEERRRHKSVIENGLRLQTLER